METREEMQEIQGLILLIFLVWFASEKKIKRKKIAFRGPLLVKVDIKMMTSPFSLKFKQRRGDFLFQLDFSLFLFVSLWGSHLTLVPYLKCIYFSLSYSPFPQTEKRGGKKKGDFNLSMKSLLLVCFLV